MQTLKLIGTERERVGWHGWLHAMHDSLWNMPLSKRDERNQRLRLHRFFLASAFSLLYLAVLLIFYSYGKVDGETLLKAVAMVTVLIVAFFLLFQLGLNLRFSDPSLTSLQVLAAVFTMLVVAYRAPETRLLFTPFLFVALMFGMLRSSGPQLTVLGLVSLAGFGAVTGLRYAGDQDRDAMQMDVLQLVVTAIAFPWFVFIGSRVKQMKEADRRKDDFLATLAHELRNPLAPIRTGIQILRLTVAEPPAHAVLPMMERQLQHLTRLLDDLLDVNRITRGKIALQIERIDLRQVVNAAVEASRPLIEQMGHEFTIAMPSEPVLLDADPVRLAQILSNLLNNAAKYTPPGGRIALAARHHDDELELSVIDNGIGIPGERLESIFDMFAQIEASAPDAQGGLGIGLSLVKGLVALHRGSIEVRSDGPGRGSEFRVRLPTRLAHSQQSVRTPEQLPLRARQKILVVDDNRDAASSLRMLLELMGHEVRIADGGAKAVRLAAGFRPHIVLLDLGMPGMDGYEACRRIRKAAWGKDMRLIALTGWGQDEDRRRCVAAGFDAHLVKPVKPDRLVELVGDVRSPS
jgi:signal transduction histidine kinase/CheY-like chemotaxis protein